jgi:hypothetical protein
MDRLEGGNPNTAAFAFAPTKKIVITTRAYGSAAANAVTIDGPIARPSIVPTEYAKASIIVGRTLGSVKYRPMNVIDKRR